MLAASIAEVIGGIARLRAAATREWNYVREALTAFRVADGGGLQSGDHPGSAGAGRRGRPVEVRSDLRRVPAPRRFRQGGGDCNEARRTFGETASVPGSLEECRASLFFEQRRWRHFGTPPDPKSMDYLRAVVRRIADVSGGQVEAEAPTL